MKAKIMKKSQVFEKELNLIEKETLRDFIAECLEKAPDYFFTMPASTTGKYHPEYSLGEGGLIRHTQAAVKIANDLLRLEMYAKLLPNRDEIIAALIMHDSIKKGVNSSAYTTVDHPLQASQFIRDRLKNSENTNYPSDIDLICSMIDSHMGQWNSDRSGREIMPRPQTLEQKFVHLCDYLASRKFLIVLFDEE